MLVSDILSAACMDGSLISLADPQSFIQESEEREGGARVCGIHVRLMLSHVFVTAS